MAIFYNTQDNSFYAQKQHIQTNKMGKRWKDTRKWKKYHDMEKIFKSNF